MPRPLLIPERGDVQRVRVAARMGLSEAEFDIALPKLIRRGFPLPDPDTGCWCIEAVDIWRTRVRHPELFPLTATAMPTDPGRVEARLARIR